MGNMSQTCLKFFFLEHSSLILFGVSTLSYEILQDGMYGAEVGRGSFIPQKPFLQTSFSTETGVAQ